MWRQHLADETATVNAGRQLGELIAQGGYVVYLEGRLGAGKTTFCRGVLNSFGYSGKVKSPTYTLVEPYHTAKGTVYHFDLYRLADPDELEYIGVRDYFVAGVSCLVEWPERGRGVIAAPDLLVCLELAEQGREMKVNSKTTRGAEILTKLKETSFEVNGVNGVQNEASDPSS